MSARLKVRHLEETEWASFQHEWNSLLETSDADRLFLSWDWITLWWQFFRSPPEESLLILAVYDGDALIGMAPMIIGVIQRRVGLRVRSAQLVGYRLDGREGMLSEYLDVVATRGRESEVRAAILESLIKSHGCGEVVIGWSLQAQAWTACTRQTLWQRLRLDSPNRSYQVDLANGFEAYLARLGSSTRRSVFNLRRRLEQLGKVEFLVASASECAAALDDLNRLHSARWGSQAFKGRKLEFHRELIDRWKDLGQIVISRLLVAGVCVSVLYDIRVGERQYNIQMGFDASVEPKVSLGLIHLGYAIEQASNQGVRIYDFLGGGGKTSDYKKNLASSSHSVHTIHVLNGFWPVAISRLRDWLRPYMIRNQSAS